MGGIVSQKANNAAHQLSEEPEGSVLEQTAAFNNHGQLRRNDTHALTPDLCGERVEGVEEPFICRTAKISPDKLELMPENTIIACEEYPQVYSLGRGGNVVQTSSHGGIQFGIPPESIKDCLNNGMTVPTYYVIYGELFDRNCGLSVAEFEFPIYFNYFVKKRKVTVITTPMLQERIEKAFQETLFGPTPEDIDIAADFPEGTDPSKFPNFVGEGIGLDAARSSLKLSDLIDFIPLKMAGVTKLGEHIKIKFSIKSSGRSFQVSELEEVIAEVPAEVTLQTSSNGFNDVLDHFQTPSFGITVLGTSHGFDPNGNTTGFVLWAHHIGYVVDPPPDTSLRLEKLGISPASVQGIILTHCHADHDAGTFQKILRQRQVHLYTTKTIKDSFLRKYSAITGFDIPFLESLFVFKQVKIDEPMMFGCMSIKFHYSLHTIPCIGFCAQWGSNEISYSADTNYSPNLVQKLYDDKVIGEMRRDSLLNNFNWDATVVIHELGVPPIHTAVEELQKRCDLDPTLKDRLFIVHSAKNPSLGFKQLEDANTLEIPIQRCSKCLLKEMINTLKQQYFLGPLWKHEKTLCNICQAADWVMFQPGEQLVQAGDAIEDILILLSGTAEIFGHTGGAIKKTQRVSSDAILAGTPKQFSQIPEEQDESVTDIPDKVIFPCMPEVESAPEKYIHAPSNCGLEGLLHAVCGSDRDMITDDRFAYSLISKTTVTAIRISIKDFMGILGVTPYANSLYSNLKWSNSKEMKLTQQLLHLNPTLERIIVEQECLEEFAELLIKRRCSRGEKLAQVVLVEKGTIGVSRPSIGGTFRGISGVDIGFQEMRNLSTGTLVGDINKVVKGIESDIIITAETDVKYYEVDVVKFRTFLGIYPGVLLQLLDKFVLHTA